MKQSNKRSLSARFILTAIIAIVVFVIFQCISLKTMKQSQREIIEKFCEHIEKADQSVENLRQYALDNMIGIQDASSRVVADSLIKASLGKGKPLTEVQYKALINTIESHFSHFSTIRDEYEAKFLQDSLFLSVEHTLLNGQTKSMLQLHLDKIEHEYSNITMWAAILTLVFLVFSFYSMFKLEEYIKKGKDGADEIDKLRIKGNNHINELEDIKNKILNNSQDSIKDYISAAKIQLDNLDSQYQTKLNLVDAEFTSRANESIEKLQAYIREEASKNISSSLEQLSQQYTSIKANFDDKYSEINNQINDLISKLRVIEEASNLKADNILKSE